MWGLPRIFFCPTRRSTGFGVVGSGLLLRGPGLSQGVEWPVWARKVMIATEGLVSSMVVWPGFAGCLTRVSGYASFSSGNSHANECLDMCLSMARRGDYHWRAIEHHLR